jgi:hypothetical protein
VLPQLESQRAEIEKELGLKPEWNPNKEAKDKIIVVYHDADLHERGQWDEYLTWLVDTASRIRNVFMPRVKKLVI